MVFAVGIYPFVEENNLLQQIGHFIFLFCLFLQRIYTTNNTAQAPIKPPATSENPDNDSLPREATYNAIPPKNPHSNNIATQNDDFSQYNEKSSRIENYQGHRIPGEFYEKLVGEM